MTLNAQPWPKESASIGADEVRVWCADLAQARGQVDRFEPLLSPDEIVRAQRFRFDRDRIDYVLARGLLRTLLGRQLGMDPADVAFTYTAHGKPALAVPQPLDLRFNLSHSADRALIALTCGRDVGIDVEQVRPEVAQERVAEEFFTPAETASIRALAPESQALRFFGCWVRKEAALKAWGVGLSLELNRFDVSSGTLLCSTLIGPDGTPGVGRLWTVRELEVGPGYSAALVAEGERWTVRYLDWLWS